MPELLTRSELEAIVAHGMLTRGADAETWENDQLEKAQGSAVDHQTLAAFRGARGRRRGRIG